MKRSTFALGVAAVALWSAGALAQGRNFSGNWTIDTERMQEIAAAGGGGAVVAAGGGGMRSGGGGGRGGGAVGGVVTSGEVRRIGGDAGTAAAGVPAVRSAG